MAKKSRKAAYWMVVKRIRINRPGVPRMRWGSWFVEFGPTDDRKLAVEVLEQRRQDNKHPGEVRLYLMRCEVASPGRRR